jgi:transcriptional regulator with XRE-family HTH domain
MTMEQLARASGVSAKTISIYEAAPPGRPAGKVVEKISKALGITPDVLMKAIGAKVRVKKGAVQAEEEPRETIELEDVHVVRILVLIEKELMELNQTMLETASLADDYPLVEKGIEYLARDIDLLLEMKGRLT